MVRNFKDLFASFLCCIHHYYYRPFWVCLRRSVQAITIFDLLVYDQFGIYYLNIFKIDPLPTLSFDMCNHFSCAIVIDLIRTF